MLTLTKNKLIIVTGAAGFIGVHLSNQLTNHGYSVIGLDNMNTYYDLNLKKDRLAQLNDNKNFTFVECDLTDRERINKIFEEHQTCSCH